MRYKILFGLLVFWMTSAVQAQDVAHSETHKLMGSRFEITAVASDQMLAEQGVQAAAVEIRRIEHLISSWEVTSQTSAINQKAGLEAVRVDLELFLLIQRSLKVSKLTGGAFDISYASVDKLWRFEQQEQDLPPPDYVEPAVSMVGYQKIVLNQEDTSVYLSEPGMKISFGAIGKGYAANRAMIEMKQLGIGGGVVNASGDLIGWGVDQHGKDWHVAVADPTDLTKVLAWLSVTDGAVVTSGNYEKYFISEGKRYAHIIDPRTGYPTTGIKSVTIVCPDAELADALATSIFVLGEEKGLNLINQLNGIECLIVNDQDNMITSNHLELNYYSLDLGQNAAK